MGKIQPSLSMKPRNAWNLTPRANRLTKCATHGCIKRDRKSRGLDFHQPDTYAVYQLSEALQGHDFLPSLLRLYVAGFMSRSETVGHRGKSCGSIRHWQPLLKI